MYRSFFFPDHCIKQTDSMLLCVCSVIDHRGRPNVVKTSVTHSPAARVPLHCFYHILTSSVIYYWTDARQHGIYLLNTQHVSCTAHIQLHSTWESKNQLCNISIQCSALNVSLTCEILTSLYGQGKMSAKMYLMSKADVTGQPLGSFPVSGLPVSCQPLRKRYLEGHLY